MKSIIRILLLSDDQVAYGQLAQMLSEAPGQSYEVDRVGSAQDALEVLAQGEHDIALVDYDLPNDCGIEVIRRSVEQDLPAPLVLLTGRGSLEVDMQAMKAGASDFLVKGEFSAQLLERTTAMPSSGASPSTDCWRAGRNWRSATRSCRRPRPGPRHSTPTP